MMESRGVLRWERERERGREGAEAEGQQVRGGEERVACEFKKKKRKGGERNERGARVHKREREEKKRVGGFFSPPPSSFLLPHLSPEPSQIERSGDGKQREAKGSKGREENKNNEEERCEIGS